MTTKPCIICSRELDSICDDWDTMQPSGGGEVRFIFSYGSGVFDLHPYRTQFIGVICDSCSKDLVTRMTHIGLPIPELTSEEREILRRSLKRVDTPCAEMTDEERELAEELLREEEEDE